MDVLSNSRRLARLSSALLLGLLAMLPVHAADRDEHARIAAERRALNAQLSADEAVCRQRFVVTACVDEVRAHHRKALAPLRQRELALEDAERQQRVAERAAAVAAKQQAAAARPAASAPQPPRLRTVTRAAPLAASSPSKLSRTAEDADARAAQAGGRARDSAARRAEAAQAQDHVAERQARLDARNKAKGKAPEPLPLPQPVPTAASAAGQVRR